MGAIAQYRAESKDSKSLDSAIFAEQKSNEICSASAHTTSRPCRGGENALKKCSSAFLAFLTRQGDSEALSPIAVPKACKQSAAKTAALYLFRGFESAGRGEPLFLLRKQVILRI